MGRSKVHAKRIPSATPDMSLMRASATLQEQTAKPMRSPGGGTPGRAPAPIVSGEHAGAGLARNSSALERARASIAMQHQWGNARTESLLGGDEVSGPASQRETEASDANAIVMQAGPRMVKLGSQTHEVAFRMRDGQAQVGVASIWTSFERMAGSVRLKILAEKLDPTYAVRKYRMVKFANDALKMAKLTYTVALGLKRSRQETKSLTKDIEKSRKRLVDAVVDYIEGMYEHYGQPLVEVLGIRRLIKAQKPKINPSKTYHTGSSSDPIPIVWYKDPRDYGPIHVKIQYRGTFNVQPVKAPKTLYFNKGGSIRGFDGKNVVSESFTVSDANKPKLGWRVQKVAHSSKRKEQKRLNRVLKNAGFKMGRGSKLDGDHVKDLGFGGADQISNYWPLNSRINQRAAKGYNTSYVVNYIAKDGSYKAKAVGGLWGRWFKVKGFMSSSAGSVPTESSSTKAGTDDI